MSLLKILSLAGATAWLYASTANAQENVNPLDRDLSALVFDGQQLIQDLQRDLLEGMAAGEGRQRGSRESTMGSLSLPRTAENTAKNMARERTEAKESYVDGMCQAIGLVSYPVVDENGRQLPMGATYQHPDGTVSLIGVATLEGMDETIAQNCARIVGKSY